MGLAYRRRSSGSPPTSEWMAVPRLQMRCERDCSPVTRGLVAVWHRDADAGRLKLLNSGILLTSRRTTAMLTSRKKRLMRERSPALIGVVNTADDPVGMSLRRMVRCPLRVGCAKAASNTSQVDRPKSLGVLVWRLRMSRQV